MFQISQVKCHNSAKCVSVQQRQCKLLHKGTGAANFSSKMRDFFLESSFLRKKKQLLSERTVSVWKLSIIFSGCCHWLNKRIPKRENIISVHNIHNNLNNSFCSKSVLHGRYDLNKEDSENSKNVLECTDLLETNP